MRGRPLPRRTALPAELTQQPFLVAEAIAAGVAPNRLRLDDLVIPTPGVRSAEPAARLVARAEAFALVLPDDVAFSHTTALALHGLPIGRLRPDATTSAEPLHVMRVTSRPPIRRRGCVSHRGLESRRLTTAGGLRVTAPVDSWLDSAALLTRDDLVAAGDALVMPPWHLTTEALVRAAEKFGGRRAVVRARDAAGLVRPGSASPQESRARCLMGDWGLPEPELNVDIHDDAGTWLARPDFVWRTARVVAEYDGDQHRTDRRRWQYERERRARLEDANWAYVEFAANALWPGRVQEELRRRLLRELS